MGRNWTPGQRDAIEARGGTLLVSAAAGSGKTAVLVQRVIERLTDERHPTDADRLLVVTFTKAAAAEMRDRIAAQIALLLEEDPYNVRLQRQQILLARAQISTIHSFCSELVRENFYKLGVSPDFRILDDAEMTLAYLAQIAGESDNLSFGAEGLDMNVEQERGYIEGITGRSLLLLGFIGDELAAMGALKCMRRERAQHRASLSVTVRKKYWHRGIGTQMVNHLIEHARQGGISVIELEVRSDNVSAISLCQKMGFERIGVYPKFFRINGRDYDADLMNLYL